MTSSPDPDALLAALVLCPGTYSRNRFFSLYKNPEASVARRRAAMVRSIIAELAHDDPLRRGRVVSIDDPGTNGFATMTYVVPALELRRSTLLSELELSMIRYAVTRRIGATDTLDVDDAVRLRIENALQGLSPDIAEVTRVALEQALFDSTDDESEESALNDTRGEG